MIHRLTPKQVYSFLLFYNLFFWFSRELARPSISISLSDRLDSASLIGSLLALQSFLPILFAIPSSTIGDKYGHERVMHLGSYLTVISGVCFLVAGIDGVTPLQYIMLISIGQVISGISWTIVWISLQSLTAENAQDSGGSVNVKKAVNQLVLVMSAGTLLGPLVAGQLMTRFDVTAVWIFYAGLSLLQFVFSWMLSVYWRGKRCTDHDRPKPDALLLQAAEVADARPVHRWKKTWNELGGSMYSLVLLCTFIMMFGAEIRGSYLTVYLRGTGVAADDIGMIVMWGAFASAIVRLLLNLPLAEGLSRRFCIALSVFCTVAGVITIGLLPPGYANSLSSILLGLGGGIGEPVLILLIVENVSKSRRGMAMAGRVLTNRLAMFMSPLSTGWAVFFIGNQGGFISVGITLGALAAFSVLKLNLLLKRGNLHENDSAA